MVLDIFTSTSENIGDVVGSLVGLEVGPFGHRNISS